MQHLNDNVSGFQCQCKPGYTGSKCEVNINDCEENPCKNNATCHDKVIFYEDNQR